MLASGSLYSIPGWHHYLPLQYIEDIASVVSNNAFSIQHYDMIERMSLHPSMFS
jgi:hypothetical protein